MSERHPRIVDDDAAPKGARELLRAAQNDVPPAGARERALRRLEARLSDDEKKPSTEDAPSAPTPATGARNENSVLFSLSSLMQSPGATPGSASSSEPKKAAGDESGLIDVKSLGSLKNASSGESSAKESASALLTGSSGGAGLVNPLAAPVLAPVPPPTAPVEAAPPPAPNRTVLYASIAVAAILAAGGVGAAFLLRGDPTPPAAPTTPVTPPPTPTPTPTPTANPPANPTGTTATPTPNPSVATGSAPSGSAPAGGEDRRHRTRPAERPSGSATAPSTTQTSATQPAAPAAPQRPTVSGSCAQQCRGNIDCLLRCGVEGNSGGGAHGPAPAAAAPGREAPTREDVLGAMRSVNAAVQRCSTGTPGTATVSITFASSGRVTSANVGPPFAGTPAGSCIASAVRGASVPAFSRPSFNVNYPFVLR